MHKGDNREIIADARIWPLLTNLTSSFRQPPFHLFNTLPTPAPAHSPYESRQAGSLHVDQSSIYC